MELLGGSFALPHLSRFIGLVISTIPWIPIPNRLRVDVWDMPVSSCGAAVDGWAGVPPSPVDVCSGHGDHQEPWCTCSPLHSTCQEVFGLSPGNWGLSGRDGPLIPMQDFWVPAATPGLPSPCLAGTQRWQRYWEALSARGVLGPVGKHLVPISSTCYLESGS